MNMTNRTVLITGGGSGIGFALAKALIERGNVVVAVGRDADKLERARAAVPGLRTFVADVTNEQDRYRLYAWAGEHLPELDVLINNAGIARRMDFGARDLDADEVAGIDEEVATNFLAPVHLTARFLPLLRRRPSAVIVNVSAVLAYAPIASLSVHSATKAAVRSFTRSLRRQLAGTSVRVVEIVPPVVDTAMQRDLAVPKLDPGLFARKVIEAIDRGEIDVHVGQAKVFRAGSRIAPEALFRLLNRTVERSTASNAGPATVRASAVAMSGAARGAASAPNETSVKAARSAAVRPLPAAGEHGAGAYFGAAGSPASIDQWDDASGAEASRGYAQSVPSRGSGDLGLAAVRTGEEARDAHA
jgi:uncharacterized oxidoreductase